MDNTFTLPPVGPDPTLLQAFGEPTESGPQIAKEIEDWEEMDLGITPKVEAAQRKVQDCDAKISDDNQTAKRLGEKESGLRAALKDFESQCMTEQAATIDACDSRSLAQGIRARVDELDLVHDTGSWLRGPVCDDNLDARAVAGSEHIGMLAFQADIRYGLCNAKTQAAVLQAAPDELTLMIVGARSQALKVAADELHRSARNAEQALRELRDRRKARDAARKATGNTTKENYV